MTTESARPDDDYFAEMGNRARSIYLIPPPEAQFAELERGADGLEDAGHSEIVSAFLYSVRTTLSSVTLPYTMAFAATQDIHWQRLYSAESIRALKENSTSEQARSEIAARSTEQKFNKFVKSEDGNKIFLGGILKFLLRIADAGLEDAARHLLEQGTVLLWSSLEVLARDAVEYELNKHPQKAAELAKDAEARKRFSLERIPFDLLIAYDLDLSEKFGTVLVRNSDFSSLPTVKLALTALFPNAADLREALSDRVLWTLFQRRHLFAHRRGIVDAAYVEKTGEKLSLGTRLVVSPEEFEIQLECVLRVGLTLLKELQNSPELA